MAEWLEKRVDGAGSVLYRGSLPPQPPELRRLREGGAQVVEGPADEAAAWVLEVRHPHWGQATVCAFREAPLPPEPLFDFDPGLTGTERAEARLAGSSVSVKVAAQDDVLRDRKRLLHFLHALLDDFGLIAFDHVSQRIWSRAALEDELSHDADADIEALYCLHAITRDAGGPVVWLHSHGLAEIGRFDFDILQPSPDLFGRGRDGLRSLAFAIAEGRVQPDTARFTLAAPGGDVRLMPVAEFHRRAPEAVAQLRLEADEEHSHQRAVLCEPGGGWLKRWRPVEPSRFLSAEFEDGAVFSFSREASRLMADRARLTLGRLRELAAEFAEFECGVLAKLGYETDAAAAGDDADAREHLWFTVHDLQPDRMEATLENEPFHISGRHQGDRGWHSVDRLSDWILATPAGMITPRNFSPARHLREKADEIRKALREEPR